MPSHTSSSVLALVCLLFSCSDRQAEGSTRASDTNRSSESESPTTDEGDSENDPICGDGIVDPGEQCDLGPANAWAGAECQPDCTLNECGDGHVGPEELCEPPGCSPDCQQLPLSCGNQVFDCGDWVDNDEDGLTDLHDPDCLSPCDDSEFRLGLGQPLSGGSDGCQFDCLFDANTGRGDDHCESNPRCDPLDPGGAIGCEYDPNLLNCGPLELQCLELCLPITANGCDCFGCCEIDGVFRALEYSSCSAGDLDQCPPCTPHPECFNPCEADGCEVCLLGELAPDCEAPSCPAGAQPCTDPYACPEGEFCQTGCCRLITPEW